MVPSSTPTFTSSAASSFERSPSPSRLPYQESHSRRRNRNQESARAPLSPSSPTTSSPSRLNPGHLSPSVLTFPTSPYYLPPHHPPQTKPDHSSSLPYAFSPLHSDNYQNQQQQKQHSRNQYPTHETNPVHTKLTNFPLVPPPPPPVPSNRSFVIPRRESSFGLEPQPFSHNRSTQLPISSPTANSFDSRSSHTLNSGVTHQISSPTANSFDPRIPPSLSSGAAYQRYAATTAAARDLTPPTPSYISSQSRPSTSRPNSIVSFSAFSTHSNEPLHQSKSNKTSNKLQKLYSLSKKSSTNTMTNTNYMNLPEHRRMYNGSGYDGSTLAESARGMSAVNLNDAHLTRGPSQSSIRSSGSGSSLKRGSRWKAKWDEIRPRKYNPQHYNIKGFGKLAQFSNERLYLHWIRFGVLQASIAVMLLSFGIGIASWVGVGTLVLAMLTLIYATQLFHKRHLYMVTKRKDVKFFARTIPTLLTFGLFFLYGGNFACKYQCPSFYIIRRMKASFMYKIIRLTIILPLFHIPQ